MVGGAVQGCRAPPAARGRGGGLNRAPSTRPMPTPRAPSTRRQGARAAAAQSEQDLESQQRKEEAAAAMAKELEETVRSLRRASQSSKDVKDRNQKLNEEIRRLNEELKLSVRGGGAPLSARAARPPDACACLGCPDSSGVVHASQPSPHAARSPLIT